MLQLGVPEDKSTTIDPSINVSRSVEVEEEDPEKLFKQPSEELDEAYEDEESLTPLEIVMEERSTGGTPREVEDEHMPIERLFKWKRHLLKLRYQGLLIRLRGVGKNYWMVHLVVTQIPLEELFKLVPRQVKQ